MRSTYAARLGLCLLGLLPGCATTGSLSKHDPELKAIIEAYKRQEASPAGVVRGVRLLEVTPGEGGALRVSADLEEAALKPVVERILADAKVPYVLRVRPGGTVSARFEGLSLVPALNLILGGQGLAASLGDGILTVDLAVPDPVQAAKATDAQASPVAVEISLASLDSADAQSLMAGLYPTNPVDGSPLVRVGAQPYTNSVVLVGPADEVARAVRVLRQADRAPAHVLIEALVVEFDAGVLERLGTELSGVAHNTLSGGGLAAGLPLLSAVTFTYLETARNATTLTLTLDALVEQDRARLLSRPYIATLSGKEATIEITRNRYVIVESAQDGAAVSTAAPIASGITLKITPTVSADGRVRMDVDVEDSQFIPTAGNVAVEVDKNHAATSMVVASGQSVVIGGLVLNRHSQASSGVPLLRDVPLLNLLFGRKAKEVQKQEVAVYLTPHVWTPGMSLPMRDIDAFTINDPPPDAMAAPLARPPGESR